jgi:hypothetical protein
MINYVDHNVLSNKHPLEWDDNYTSYIHPIGGKVLIQNFSITNNTNSWKVTGKAKNSIDEKISMGFIYVSFFSKEDVLLSVRNSLKTSIPVNGTWNFSIRYDGPLKNNVSYVSFEVITNPLE